MVKSNTVTVNVGAPPKPPEWFKYLGLLIPTAVIIWYIVRGRKGGGR